VINCQEGIPEYHAGAGKSHDLPDIFSHFRLVTMHRALTAYSFPGLKRAGVKPPQSVGGKFSAVSTQTISMVVFFTIKLDHHRDGFTFSFYTGRLIGHMNTKQLEKVF
jgi:hypothetical protein